MKATYRTRVHKHGNIDCYINICTKRRSIKRRKECIFYNLLRMIDTKVNNKIIMDDLNGRSGNDNKGVDKSMGKAAESSYIKY